MTPVHLQFPCSNSDVSLTDGSLGAKKKQVSSTHFGVRVVWPFNNPDS
jgi:hypothetical protein